MIIFVDGPSDVALRDAGNFREFKVVSPLNDLVAVGRCLEASGAGAVIAEHAWISQDWLRRAGMADDANWLEGLEGMVGYARSKGFLDAAGERIRAHIEFGSA